MKYKKVFKINLFSSFIHKLQTVLLKIVNTVCPRIQFLCANVRSIHVQCIHVLVANKEIAQYSVHLGNRIVGTLFVLCTDNYTLYAYKIR